MASGRLSEGGTDVYWVSELRAERDRNVTTDPRHPSWLDVTTSRRDEDHIVEYTILPCLLSESPMNTVLFKLHDGDRSS